MITRLSGHGVTIATGLVVEDVDVDGLGQSEYNTVVEEAVDVMAWALGSQPAGKVTVMIVGSAAETVVVTWKPPGGPVGITSPPGTPVLGTIRIQVGGCGGVEGDYCDCYIATHWE